METRLANHEVAEACVVFASGTGAVGSLRLSLLSRGDEPVVHRTVHSNTFALKKHALPRFGIKVGDAVSLIMRPEALLRDTHPRSVS